MLDNHLYNLVNQLAQENKSLWRIKKLYKEDAASCGQCQDFWRKMEEEKEKYVEELRALIKTHI
jgi:hypothetical protein